VPYLRDPGYGKLQIGIYIAAIEDALGRHRLEKCLSSKIPPHDGNDGQGPGGTDHDNPDDSDEDHDHDDDQHRSKRHRGHDKDIQGATDPNTSNVSIAKHFFPWDQSLYTYPNTSVGNVANSI
jgi:hypothetical protein